MHLAPLDRPARATMFAPRRPSLISGQCYEDLVVKFPGSSSLLLDYAQFCEDILNDQAKASKLRRGAVAFEAGVSACFTRARISREKPTP